MKRLCILVVLVCSIAAQAQTLPIKRSVFFTEEKPIEVVLTTDIKRLCTEKSTPAYQPASVEFLFADSTRIKEEIRIQPRGEYRKNNCDIAALMFNFNNSTSPKLSPLKKLKFVGGCSMGAANEEYLLKEYLTYKIYNELTDLSFRVRLLHVKYIDSKGRGKPYTQYGFLIEDVVDLAARNDCKEVKNKKLFMDQTNREQMTTVGLFQYMIGNTDWSVPNYHNIKLVVPKKDTMAAPLLIPYDFDYTGLVNAPYAVPSEMLAIKSVTERLYRAYARTIEELDASLAVFMKKKKAIYNLVESCELISSREKKSMVRYLDDFYEVVSKKENVKYHFITNALNNQ